MRSMILLACTLVLACSSEPRVNAPKTLRSLERPIKDSKTESYSAAKLRDMIKMLAPHHDKFGPSQPGDWVLSHDEAGQTFEEYLKADPVLPRGERKVLYVQPLGDFNVKQREIIELSAEFMGLYFNLDVTLLADLGLEVIPAGARRTHPSWGGEQILSTYVLDDVLKPRLPEDAAAYIAFTASDLWPGRGWNFVFGQASTRHRVGVWSIHRNGDPDEDFELCLLRTIKTATHETGHMFTLMHCTAYECNMCGSNNRSESDRRPLALCPECLAKVCWATRTDPVVRFEKVRDFCKRLKLDEEAAFYDELLTVLQE